MDRRDSVYPGQLGGLENEYRELLMHKYLCHDQGQRIYHRGVVRQFVGAAADHKVRAGLIDYHV